ncbi:MAG: GH92 family glycosyl hydrolase [Kiritimatiellae bacterium]|nr:GH92 family glycosyl hydrolase [Kiritimatiellia bacterium]
MPPSVPSSSLLAWADPLQGTDSSFELSRGNCLPLVSVPWAMTAWSAQTAQDERWFFRHGDPLLRGVRATHQPSPWLGDYGWFVLMPQTGERVYAESRARASPYRQDRAVFHPHYFRAELIRYGVTLELTPTERCAVVRMGFAEGAAGRLLIVPGPGEAGFRLDPGAGRVTGYTRSARHTVPASFACHFVIQFERPFDGHGFVQGRDLLRDTAERTGEELAAFVEFGVRARREVTLRVATSFISAEQAQRNLDTELGTAGFEEIRERAARRWMGMMDRLVPGDAPDARRRTLAGCLYRALLFPRPFYETDGANRTVHYSPMDGQVHPGVLYTDNGFWDTYRTVYPFYSLLCPDRLSEILQGWTPFYAETGWFPKWPSPGHTGCMIGSHIDAVYADAVTKGIGEFELEWVYEGLRKHAFEEPGTRLYGREGIGRFRELGYVPEGAARHAAAATMDYAYGDFCLAQLARRLGRHEDARLLAASALNYRNVIDPAVGFLRGRREDGAWLEPFDPFAWGGPYVEGSAWQCSWAAPHDPEGLMACVGGRAAFVGKLDRLFELPPRFEPAAYGAPIHEMTEMALAGFGQYAHSNQPVHQVLYLYTAAGQPWKTQYWVKRVLTELYRPGPAGFPGDEDNGEMACWYLLSALGLFPLCPGHPSYVLAAPLFPELTLAVPGREPLELRAPGAEADRPYLSQLRIGNRRHAATWVAHDAVARGGRWTFTLADEPDLTRTYTADELPFSLSRDGLDARSGQPGQQ